MAEITVKTEPGYEMHSSLEDQQTQQEESKATTSFCYETVTKEEVILEDEFVSPEEESATKQDMFCEECNKSFTNRALFRTHKYKHKVVKEGKYTCQICDKVEAPIFIKWQQLINNICNIYSALETNMLWPFTCRAFI